MGIVALAAIALLGLVLGFVASKRQGQYVGTLVAFVALAVAIVLFVLLVILQSQAWLAPYVALGALVVPLVLYSIIARATAPKEEKAGRPSVRSLGKVPESVRRAAESVMTTAVDAGFEPLPDWEASSQTPAQVSTRPGKAPVFKQSPESAGGDTSTGKTAPVQTPVQTPVQAPVQVPSRAHQTAPIPELSADQAPELMPVPASFHPIKHARKHPTTLRPDQAPELEALPTEFGPGYAQRIAAAEAAMRTTASTAAERVVPVERVAPTSAAPVERVAAAAAPIAPVVAAPDERASAAVAAEMLDAFASAASPVPAVAPAAAPVVESAPAPAMEPATASAERVAFAPMEPAPVLAADTDATPKAASAPVPEPVVAALEPAPAPEPEPAPAPKPTSFNAESYFERATALRDKGMFLVAAKLYAECAQITPDPVEYRKACIEQVACYVKGGRLDDARALATELKECASDLTPIEAVKLDAVLRTVA